MKKFVGLMFSSTTESWFVKLRHVSALIIARFNIRVSVRFNELIISLYDVVSCSNSVTRV